MVWGGRLLGSALGKSLPGEGPYGESWELSDHPVHRSVVAAGPLAGQCLGDLMKQERAALLGPAANDHGTFPWLIKFLDAHDWLSVQVHPDEQAVRRLWPGERSKTEAWFVLDARPGSRIYAGLLPGVDEGRLRAALAAGTVADCLHRFEPCSGDCVFLPAGTVHAVGGGVLMAEVQQTSDATYRLFDWNRRDTHGRARPLHIDEALACIDWRQGPVAPVRAVGFPVTQEADGPLRSQPLVRCPYFVLEYLRGNQPFARGGERNLQVLIVLQGHGRLETPAGDEEWQVGQVWLLPAAMPQVWWLPETPTAMLCCTLP
jgi:mannose-6-phosphate isomerase